MGAVKYFRKFLLYTVILLMSFSSLLNVSASFKVQNEKIASQDLEQYVVVDDPFERGFFGGIIQRAKIRVNQWFNGEGTIYENTTLDSIVINGQRLSISEIISNPNKLKELIGSRDEEVGLEAIEVTNNTQDKYDYKEYLDLLIKNAQPMQIVSDTTWRKESGPYYILGEVQVMKGATLTIEAGTEVYFRSIPSTKHRSGLLVDGELILKGTESEQIKLAPYGTDSTSGSWKGIYVTERGSLNAEHSVIEKAGALTQSAIYSYGPVTLDHVEIHQTKGSAVTAFSDAIITNSLFKDNEKYGIDLYRYNKSFDTVVRSNNLEGNEIAGRIIVRQTKIPDYDVSDNTATSTDLNGFVLGGDIIGDMGFTHPGKNLPYVLTNTFDVYGEMKPFTIYPKSEVDFTDTVIKVVATPKFTPEHGIVINGTLNLNNSTITSLRDNTVASVTDKTDDVPASNRDWSGLVVGESGTLNINQSTIKYANEAVYTHGNVHLNEAIIKNVFSGVQGDGKFVIHDSTFTNLEAPAFDYYAGKEALDISVRNSTFTNINDVLGKVKVYQSGGELDLVNLEASQVKKNGVELAGSFNLDTTISQPGTNLPYLIPQLVINKSAKIDVTGDTILKVENGSLMGYKAGIDVYGQLNLNGTSSNRVTVTSLRDDTIGGDSNGDEPPIKPDAGDWGSITYHSSSKNRDSQISYSDIKYGGDQYQGYAIGGEGKFNIKHSTVTDSSEAGIGILGTTTIENSLLERNHGYGVHVDSNDNFSVTMNNNHFKDNLDYAAFVEFGSTRDHIEVSGNKADNNLINGVGITGTVRYDLELSPAGYEFPYVVGDVFMIASGHSLSLSKGVVIKFDRRAQIDVEGHLKINGTDHNKVYFTSLDDDDVAGDTNNNDKNSEPLDEDWKGIVYHAESQGTFENFECKYSTLNMDYDKIPYLKAVTKGDDSVSVSKYRAAYIKSTQEGDKVYWYDFQTGVEELISDNNNDSSKSGVIIDDYSIAWIENNSSVKVYTPNKPLQSLDVGFIKSVYLNDGYIVINDGYKLHYGKYDDISKLNEYNDYQIDSDFTPVISSKYVLYKSSDGLIHKFDVNDTSQNKEIYFMMSHLTNSISMDIDIDNIAILAEDNTQTVSYPIIGDIPSWSAKQITENVKYNKKYLKIYKDNVIYFNESPRKEVYISQANDESSTVLSTFSKGYDVRGTDISNHSAILSDDELVYIVQTSIDNKEEYFVKEDLVENLGIERVINFEKGTTIAIGTNLDVPIPNTPLKGEIDFEQSISASNSLGYTLNKTTQNNISTIGVNRKIGLKSEEKRGFGIGCCKIGIVEVSFGNISLSESSSIGVGDSYLYTNSIDSYRHIGLLSIESISTLLPSLHPMVPIMNAIVMKELHEKSAIEANSNFSLGKGGALSLDTGVKLKIGKVGVGASLLETGMESNIIFEAGKDTIQGLDTGYIQLTTAFSGNFSSVLNISGDFESGTLEYGVVGKVPPEILPWNVDLKANLVSSIKYSLDDKLEIEFSTGIEDKNGFVTTRKYKINNASNFLNLDTLKDNLNNMNEEGEVETFIVDDESQFLGFINELYNLILSNKQIEYEVIMTRSFDYDLPLLVSLGENLEEDLGDDVKAGIAMDASINDQVNIVVDSGVLGNGQVQTENLFLPFVPIKDPDVEVVTANILKQFGESISPTRSKFKDNISTYKKNGNFIQVIAPEGHNLKRTNYYELPLSIENVDKDTIEISNNQYLIKDIIYLESKEKGLLGSFISEYPEGTKLKMFIGDKWEDDLANHYAIYKYDMNNQSWVKLGGKIDSSEGSISIDLTEPGQYAIGYDKNKPKIVFKNNERELNTYPNSNNLTVDDYIDIEIIDDDVSSWKVTVEVKEGKNVVSTKDYNSRSFKYDIDGEVDKTKTYTLKVSYKDKFGNDVKREINYKIVEPVVSVIEEENSIIKDEMLQEDSEDFNSMTDDLDQNETELNTEENSSDEVMINQEGALTLQENDKESSNMINDLNQNETELNTEKDSSDEVTTNSDEDLIESE